MNYLTKPKLYNTGYLLNDTNSRLKQGLMPQDLSSTCFNIIPNLPSSIYCKNCCGDNYNYLNNNVYRIAQRSTQDTLIKPMISNNPLYPIYNLPINYGPITVPDNAPCTAYIQAP
jgi:hypothetical protein